MIAVLVNGVNVASSPSVTLNAGRLVAPLRATIVRLVDRVHIIDRSRIVLTRGSHQLLVRIGSRQAVADGVSLELAIAPYQSGADVMIPLRDVVRAMHERLQYDAARRMVAISVPPRMFSPIFTPAPKAQVTPTEIFTPRPVKSPQAKPSPVMYPRRTPIPVKLDVVEPPL